MLSLICIHRNDLVRAAQAAQAAESRLMTIGARYRSHWAVLARALILDAQGKPGDAFAMLTAAWDLCTRLGLALECRVIGADLVRLALGAGDVGRCP